MPIANADVAAKFAELADLLEIEGANTFRVRAYRMAARTLRDWPRSLEEMVEQGEDLTDLPGIGTDLAGKIQEIIRTGSTGLLEEYHKKVPAALTELLHVPGLGPKRVKTLVRKLNIQNPAELLQAAQAGRIQALSGFGAKTEQRILETLTTQAASTRRFLLAVATQYAEPLVGYLRQGPGVRRVAVAGSYRRAKDTVGDLDILVTASAGKSVTDRFVAYPEAAEILAHGETKASIRLKSLLQIDLRVVPEESYGAALQYFTGNKDHNVALRHLAQQRGLKLNEYGIFRGDRLVAGGTEESVYAALGLQWIPPELRENRGEIEAARAGRLPHLVEATDLLGDLHVHTKATDGRDSLFDMAEAARRRGWTYLAITDHSQRLAMAKGLDAKRLLQQMEEIDRWNAASSTITLLKGVEVDILEDGSLDLPDEVLGRLDLVVGAVHSHFTLPKEQQTARILKAMDHPHFSILAHPTGRLIDQRPPYDVDMARLIRKAKARRCFLEVNAHPERLDLVDIYCQMAKAEGVLLAVNTDAHNIRDFEHVRFGIGQARRGWLEKRDVVNTRPLRELRALLKQTTQGSVIGS
ncbi:MAG TPA: DNA polymerase/3'-5' exonuclease PolX [Nitrospiraceae bacterium]|nr:DNA polymerase/3'-5' exonuclease PolX [Nitrospiraceae bacterium]